VVFDLTRLVILQLVLANHRRYPDLDLEEIVLSYVLPLVLELVDENYQPGNFHNRPGQ
jgi:hypothetical protein